MKNETNKRLVIDTNVLISAFILPNSTPGRALKKAIDGFDIYISLSTRNELRDVLSRPKFDKYFKNPIRDRDELMRDFFDLSIEASPQITITDCQDPKDNQFLELAVEVDAIYLVSGDGKDLLSMNPFRGISIISAKEFLSLDL